MVEKYLKMYYNRRTPKQKEKVMNNKRKPSYAGNLLESVIIGVLVGAFVGLYQLGMTYVVKGSKYLYQSDQPWAIVLIIFAMCVLAVLNYVILKNTKGVAGSGIPNIEVCIHEKKPTDWKKELPLMFVNSYASSFVGFPLGSEGPSVVIGGKTAQMVEDIGSNGEVDTVAMACGTGFGCAFLSPLAGLCYIFEECLDKFNIKFLLRGILMMGSAFAITSLINHHRLLEVEKVAMIPFANYYVFPLLIILNILVSIGFVKLLISIKDLFGKYKDKPLVKYFGFVLFPIILILNYLCLSWMGGGSSIIASVHQFPTIWLLLGVLILRLVITSLAGVGKVTGGLVIPMMTFGALTGQIICNICNTYFGMATDANGVIVLISMCMVFAIVTQTPITATALVYSALAHSSGNYLTVLEIIPMTAVAMFVAKYLSKLIGAQDLYKMMIATDKKYAPKESTDNKTEQALTEVATDGAN